MVAKPRILVVDDEPVVRESLRDWFTEDGYPIEMAADAREALKLLQGASWDILLTDVKMPGMDGLELQKKAREIDPGITVIIMTAYASVDSALQAIKEGAYDYVTKPLDPDDLEQIINRAAEHRLLVYENLQLKQRIEAVSRRAETREVEVVIGQPAVGSVEEAPPSGGSSLVEVEKQHIRNVLAQTSGDASKAARALGVDERTLDEKVRLYGLEASRE
jgi:DNA-binding NtrC family response regulator